ncbi:Mitochondrial/choloroplast ribosomal protein S15 [Phaffia rhodozyma]|uniref:Mitochondrial/choloroplast ribosomal protein S15 n=1 Tax=Phaffia rhodozyma TaxID=264483 RepID=A0A0F7SFA2_PHARH|nr:Mitochondrial/choloroplast ribosomal protein S15 [Phaffia rhodozyma]
MSLGRTAPVASSSGIVRSFHLSAPTFESKFKRKIRENRKRLEASKERVKRDWLNSQPDPFLGVPLVYKDGVAEHEKQWRQTKIASAILDPQALWMTGLNKPKNVFTSLSSSPAPTVTIPNEEDVDIIESEQPPSDATADVTTGATIYTPSNPIESFRLPVYMAHHLSNEEKEFLFSTLPYFTTDVKSLTTSPTDTLTAEEQARQNVQARESMKAEEQSLEAMGRILSLRNASAKVILKENMKRVIKAFEAPEYQSFQQNAPRSRKGTDTGSPEVQAAIYTLRIRALRAHLMVHHQDTANTTKLRHMAHKRKRVLEYLKTLDRVRYDKCLMELGIDKRAVEGQLVIHKFWRQIPQTQNKAQKDVKYIGQVGKRGSISQRKRRGMQGKRMWEKNPEAHY